MSDKDEHRPVVVSQRTTTLKEFGVDVGTRATGPLADPRKRPYVPAMATLATSTREQLGRIASPDEFERLATAVLRTAAPTYAALLPVGMNPAGRAVRSPVDGIGIHRGRGGRELLLIQHTITARPGLRRKWLEPETGDVAKARRILDAERARRTVRRARLVLASSQDPDERLIRDVHAAAGADLDVDFWPGSRIADFLDRNPEGQWLRKQLFGVEPERLSRSLLDTIARRGLDDYLPLVPREEVVERLLNDRLLEFARAGRGAGFLIGGSGLGKSTALRALGEQWLTDGGTTLLVPHELVEQAAGIEQAIALALRRWAPGLDPACGSEALALATPDQPLLLIVEDVNRSANPQRLIERLLGWSLPSRPRADGNAGGLRWRLLCPVWRSNAGLADTQLRAHVLDNALMVDRFETSEAMSAVERRASAAGVRLTELQCRDLAAALGEDPLLIGLNADWSGQRPGDAIHAYVEAQIADAADASLLASDLRRALDRLTESLLLCRRLYPDWDEVRGWFDGDGDLLASLRRLVAQGPVVALDATAGDRLSYRHDRVRDRLLTGAMARLIAGGRLPPELWADPFYAELVGGALPQLPQAAVAKAMRHNPPAILAALQSPDLGAEHRDALVEAASQWIGSPAFSAASSDYQRHHAMRYLARTDAPFVTALAARFPASFPRLEALVRNGDARAGAKLCERSEPGMNDRWRDRMIAHACAHHPSFVADIGRIIADHAVSGDRLEGALNLAGEIGDPALCDALAERWERTDDSALSTGWLWAGLRCCPPVGHPLADGLCEAWAKLPTRVGKRGDTRDRNPRWDIAGHSLGSAFRRKPEPSAIAFLLARARDDRRLRHVLSSILREVDRPEAILYMVDLAAHFGRRAEAKGMVNFLSMDLQRSWSPDQHGRALSRESRAALEPVWRDRRVGPHRRKMAFRVWSRTPERADVAAMASLDRDPVLADAALAARLEAGDRSALPLLRKRIASGSRSNYWWYQARGVGIAGLEGEIEHYLVERGLEDQADGRVTDSDHILAELLMDSRSAFAEELLVRHWDRLKASPDFVQAAFYLATPSTVALARSAVEESSDPAALFEHIDMHWGIKTQGRPGITDLAQLQALEPYYALISEHHYGDLRISGFFGAANALGALEWRKANLDPLLADGRRGYCPADPKALFASLDEEVETYNRYARRHFGIDHWIERREQELWSRRALLDLVAHWAADRASGDAAVLLCETLLGFGERSDLALLDRLEPRLQAAANDSIANCTYEVRRRSLD